MSKSSTPRQPTKHSEVCLLVYEETLVQLGTERHILLSESDDSHRNLNAERLAEAARHLLPDTTAKQRVTLFLPAHEFVSAQVVMPGVAAENLYDAVRLQQPMLLPGFTAPLLLSIQAPPKTVQPPLHDHVALWMPVARAEELFAAFRQRSLFLYSILPRPLAALGQADDAMQRIRDEDRSTVTYLEWRYGTIRRWLYMPKDDCEEFVFEEQFEQAVQQDLPADAPELSTQTALETWKNLPMPRSEVYRYCFITPGTQGELARRQRQRRLWQIQITAGISIVMLGVIVGGLFFVKQNLERELSVLKEQTTDVSRLREEIFIIEEKIGPVRDFPRQNMLSLLVHLNGLIPKESWITALKVIDGTVEIEGESPDPPALLEKLTQQAEFAEVAFSGPTQGRRFKIGFRLVGIDVQEYLRNYFPHETR